MKYAMDKSLAKNETFAAYYTGNDVEITHEARPSFARSITPIAVLIVINLVGSFYKVENIVLISLAVAIILSAILFNKEIDAQKQVINEGANSGIIPMLLTGSAVAFGVIITLAPGFSFISDFILNMSSNPLISLSFASALFGGITASATGSLGIVMEAFGQTYIDMGLDPQVIHRVAAIASSTLAVMPHGGGIISFLALAGLNHKIASRTSSLP